MSNDTNSIPKRASSKYKRKPSIKQRKAFDNLVGNGGNVAKAMIDAGYSAATANTPQKLTESIGFKSLAEQIPDSLVIEKHLALLNKKEVKRTFNHETGEWIEVETGQVDTEAVKAGVKMAYELKGAFAPTKSLNVSLTIDATAEEILKLQQVAQTSLSQLDEN